MTLIFLLCHLYRTPECFTVARPLKYEKEKEQSEYANNKACCKAVLLFKFCLMFIVNNHKLLTS